LEKAYKRGKGRSKKAREHALAYDADLVWETYWLPYLEKVAAGSQISEPVVTQVSVSKSAPHLTIYIPAYRRMEVAKLLESLAPQLTAEVELIVSDDCPNQTAKAATLAIDSPATVTYMHNPQRLGGVANLERGLSAGSGSWVWMISDDDIILPNTVADILAEIEQADIDRLILLTEKAPNGAAGMVGSPAEIEAAQPGLMIASTLITANVLRRNALDMQAAKDNASTLHGPAFAYAGCKRVKVHATPAFEVGCKHVGEFVASTNPNLDVFAVWSDMLNGLGIAPLPDSMSWNFVAAEAA